MQAAVPALPAWARVLTMYTNANVAAVLARRHLPPTALEVLRANSVVIQLCVLLAEAHYGFDLPAYVLVSLLPPPWVRRVGVPPLASLAAVADVVLHAAPVALMGLPGAWWAFPAASALLLSWYALVRSTVGLRAVYWRRAPDTAFLDHVLFRVVPAAAVAVAVASWAASTEPQPQPQPRHRDPTARTAMLLKLLAAARRKKQPVGPCSWSGLGRCERADGHERERHAAPAAVHGPGAWSAKSQPGGALPQHEGEPPTSRSHGGQSADQG